MIMCPRKECPYIIAGQCGMSEGRFITEGCYLIKKEAQMSKFIDFGNTTLRQAYIIKHALRDSLDPEAQKLYQEVSEKIDERKKEMKIN